MRAHLRAVLHHQGAGQGHRPRAGDRLRHRQAARRPRSTSTASRARARRSASTSRASTGGRADERAAAARCRSPRGTRDGAAGRGRGRRCATSPRAARATRATSVLAGRARRGGARASPREHDGRDRPAAHRRGHAGHGRPRAGRAPARARGPGSACSTCRATPRRRLTSRTWSSPARVPAQAVRAGRMLGKVREVLDAARAPAADTAPAVDVEA